jgi:nucleoside-diphosphate-sugar epimerase
VEGVELMHVLVTGHDGYIGRSLIPFLESAGHEVTGLDTYLYAGCSLGALTAPVPAITTDIRDVRPAQLRDFDAVVHLAAISNDPLGDLRPRTTYEINHAGAVRVARAARQAGVSRFVFSSSCSLYGAQGDAPIAEDAPFNPVTPYGRSKVMAEEDISALADDSFSPVFLRNATAYGYSSRLRGDLVVNNLVGHAVTSGEVRLTSDGSPWRPLVHIEDIARAVVAVLEAPTELVHNEAFNVGRSTENYRVREVADLVESLVPDSVVRFAPGAGPDKRNYRVNCDKLPATLPSFRPVWTVSAGIEELRDASLAFGLRGEDLTGSAFGRIRRVQELQEAGRLTDSLRWVPTAATVLDEVSA